MDSGFYAACAGLRTQTEALDLVAHNLANTNTTGYRRQQPTFRSLLTGHSANPLNLVLNHFSVMGGTQLDLTPGNLRATGNPLDVAIEGAGFFAVQTSHGTLYTRDGNFRVSAKGQLVTAQGDPVLGEQGPIPVPTGLASISADGTLSIAGAVAGKLRVLDFAGSALTPVGSSYYDAGQAKGLPAAAASVRQGMLEASNVDPLAAVVNLISVQRSAEMLQRALSMFHSDFNHIAASEVPRV